MDAATARLAADGGADFRRGVYRAADSEAIDSFDQIDDAVRKIDELDGPANRRAKLLVYETDGPGVKLVDDMDRADLRTLFQSVESRDTLARLSRQFDAGTVESRHLDEITDLLDSGDMDGADLGRFSQILDQRDSDPMIDSEVGADDLLTAVRKNSDLSDTRFTLKDQKSRVRWLEDGNSQAGWKHILQRHENQFYDLPGISTRDDIQHLVYRTIKEGKAYPDPDEGTVYIMNVGSDSKVMVLVGGNGYVVTARPGTPSWFEK
ncbi:hypothetical protein [Halapricum desulfuricans]|uniref:Uncharacterized protein n=1 Tax=Halapricum desulfuricans TaxID=2841257 RepID=A0A897N3G1_9EURY|nr:hypothetical protein [Halapricum desulfuricans]QSG07522.1 Uncharacterized protein HSR122_0100 [Halapricum desulfuricans]